MDIIYCSTVLTERDGYCIMWCRFCTLTWEYETLSGNGHLVDETLSLERIDDTIEGREIHTAISLSDEFFLEISKSNTWALAESFDEPLALFCDTSVRHNIRVFSIGYLV